MHLAITNHTGARNRGAEALVRCMADGFQRYHSPLSVSLHSSDPIYDEWRFKGVLSTFWGYPLLTPNHTPFYLLNRFGYLGARLAEKVLPSTLRGASLRVQSDLKKADAVVAAGGDVFTSDYHNLRKHLAYPLMARGSPVYLCSQSVGPFRTMRDRDYFRRSAEKIDLISVRESDSYTYLKSLDIQTRLEQTADVAFTLPSPETSAIDSWLMRRYAFDSQTPCIGLSISQGIIKYSGLDPDAYYQCFAEFCDELLASGRQIMLIPHVMEKHPSNNDVIACDEVLSRIKAEGAVTVISGEPDAAMLKGAIGRCEALIGTRTHATIASMSQCIPTVSVAYSQKAFGIMKDVYGEQDGRKLTLSAKNLSRQALLEAFEHALRVPLKQSDIKKTKQSAERNFTLLDTVLENS